MDLAAGPASPAGSTDQVVPQKDWLATTKVVVLPIPTTADFHQQKVH